MNAASSTRCATPPPASPPPVYAYVLLGPEARAIARVLTFAAACPSLDVDGHRVPMSVRAAPATLPLRAGQLKASAFPVRVCEATLPEVRALRALGGAQRHAAGLIRRERREDVVQSLPVDVVGVREVGLREHRDAFVHAHEP